jgi:hypothetical protein
VQYRPSQHPRLSTLDSPIDSRRRTRRLQALGAAAAAGVLALFATGCPEPADLENPQQYLKPEVAADDPCELECVKNIFTVSQLGCKLCHNNTTLTSSQLDLVSKGVTARLRDVPSKHLDITMPPTPGDCPTGDKLIDVANPGNSWLLKKIKGEQKTCGTIMPTTSLNATDMACMETYISCVAGGKPLVGGGGGSGGGGAGGSAGAAAGNGGSAGAAAGTGGAAGGTSGSGGTGGTGGA